MLADHGCVIIVLRAVRRLDIHNFSIAQTAHDKESNENRKRFEKKSNFEYHDLLVIPASCAVSSPYTRMELPERTLW